MRIIDIEGIDGSGKTTALEFLADQLKQRGFRVLITREVGNPHVQICVDLRKLVLNPENKMNGIAMELVFSAMRLENQDFYNSIKDQYDIILNDRGWLSHLAYTDNNASPAITSALYENFLLPLTELPNEIVFLNVLPEVASSRRTSRGRAVDAIEAKGDLFQRMVKDSFLKYINRYRPVVEINMIDANQNIEGVQEQLLQLVDKYDSLRRRD